MLNRLSLSGRVTVIGLILALICTGIGGWWLRTQLHQRVLQGVAESLQYQADRIAAGFSVRDGQVLLSQAQLDQGAFGQIFSGAYWFLQRGEASFYSRSLWDSTLPTEAIQPLPAFPSLLRLTGPQGEHLVGGYYSIPLGDIAGRLYVFIPIEATREELARIDRTLWTTQFAFILALVVWSFLQVRVGLSPLRHLREQLVRVRAGEQERLGQGYGPDLDPLAQELDRMLAHNTRIVTRARHHAADLSHILKKPLTLLALDAREDVVPSDKVRMQVESMSQIIDRHLARFGSGAGQAQMIMLEPPLKVLFALMQQLHQERGLLWVGEIDPGVRWRGDVSDLEEMTGNLLDNAGKWALAQVRFTVQPGVTGVLLCIEDDGPGLAPSQIEQVARRGQRFDEATPGTGLGLAIVRDIAETYGGALELDRSPLGGLRCRLFLP